MQHTLSFLCHPNTALDKLKCQKIVLYFQAPENLIRYMCSDDAALVLRAECARALGLSAHLRALRLDVETQESQPPILDVHETHVWLRSISSEVLLFMYLFSSSLFSVST
jgi:hypothetical protein